MNNSSIVQFLQPFHQPQPLPPLTETIYIQWVEFLKPSWKYISLFSKVSDIYTFAKICSETSHSPSSLYDIQSFKPFDTDRICQLLNISVEDGMIVSLALKWDDVSSLPRGVAHRVIAESQDVKDKNFVREYTRSDTFEGVVISTSGPGALLTAEQQVHSVILFPIAFFLGLSLSNLTSVDPNMASTSLGTAALSVSVVNFLLYTFTIINSITQSVIISYANLSDYAAAYYLSKALLIRFSDVVVFSLLLLFLTPLEITLYIYYKTNYTYAIFWIWLGIAIAILSLSTIYNSAVIYNTRTLYHNHPKPSLTSLTSEKDFEEHMKSIGSWRKRFYYENFWRSSVAQAVTQMALDNKTRLLG
jgi:hypothetical protein